MRFLAVILLTLAVAIPVGLLTRKLVNASAATEANVRFLPIEDIGGP
jgi:hypothetical protein